MMARMHVDVHIYIWIYRSISTSTRCRSKMGLILFVLDNGTTMDILLYIQLRSLTRDVQCDLTSG